MEGDGEETRASNRNFLFDMVKELKQQETIFHMQLFMLPSFSFPPLAILFPKSPHPSLDLWFPLPGEHCSRNRTRSRKSTERMSQGSGSASLQFSRPFPHGPMMAAAAPGIKSIFKAVRRGVEPPLYFLCSCPNISRKIYAFTSLARSVSHGHF